jgi:hypothetical protein
MARHSGHHLDRVAPHFLNVLMTDFSFGQDISISYILPDSVDP